METPTLPDRLWTAAETCAYLTLAHRDGSPNINRLYILRSRYHLPALRMGGQLRFRKRDIDAWLDERSKEDLPELSVQHG